MHYKDESTKRASNPNLAILGDVVSDFEVSVCTGPFGMDHTFRNPLPVEVGHLVKQDNILEQERSSRPNGDHVGLVTNGPSCAGGQCRGSL